MEVLSETLSMSASMPARAPENMYVIPSPLLLVVINNFLKHWGVILTDSDKRPVLHHTSNRSGPWRYEETEAKPNQSMSLIVLVRLDEVQSYSCATGVIRSIPADGNPSERTGEAFTCRVWAKDVLVALYENGKIGLNTDIGMFTLTLSYKMPS